MTDLSALSTGLDAVAREVPGVVALYSARPAIVTTVRQLAAGSESPSLVDVRESDGSLAIVASIAVDSRERAPEIAAAVSAALLDAVPDGTRATVHVRVSRIVES
ncbi:hypothetical protein M2152_000305 [Microbacteriaceae bacterium SG_E_30_P1]|uniref:Asp23/Gls24 family envelope stress response protein n=1 Tax=Antiquaquibacter oligotrophicus TaxID=2880260 RepID=A0ABT6KJF2_9MICO|nr:hypothetical protein [Antiquaquibacter oligotrophicus]MDH6180123.1 hypothetical protein [Antiquaquibacter oligotrophicus]UDF14126.1 hypothetical protein LH407_04515 [Antiquaquibacter oligotrophicus]